MNVAHIDVLLAAYKTFSLKHKEQKYLIVLPTVYDQQEEMHRTHTHRIDYRIVNIHQPHVRPIVRGKENAKTDSLTQVRSLEGIVRHAKNRNPDMDIVFFFCRSK
jgi:hypothetical protein